MTERSEYLERFLAEHDTPCPGCGYNLRGLEGDLCPECGERLELRIGLADPRLSQFIGGLIGLAAGLGFHGLFLIWVGYMAAVERFSMWDSLPPLVVGLIGSVGAIIMWVAMRARMRRLTLSRRRVLVFVCWGWSLGTVLWFFASMRP
ncbi:MAG: hypothetical protein DYG94_01835 [Leptolyngbya sp. PLA3]|nr:MAG: hypothetical protein EDM82_00045 [Cyanobacteria bacterium CYA]MCE7967473.1 hypothetical protein [Leptolyngbya sp. PL-A3]